MFCNNINEETNEIYAMTHSCNIHYKESELPLCPYAGTEECKGYSGIEDME